MQLNVSQLLQSPVGTLRRYQVDEVVDIFGDGAGYRVRGAITLMRTHRNILVKGILATEGELVCSRCLSPYPCSLSLDIEEEYVPTVDVFSGAPLSPLEEPGSFTIDERHTLDLTEAIRQYLALTIPMKPLCREECAGLCPNCGGNLNQEPCGCPQPQVDPRWSELMKLLK